MQLEALAESWSRFPLKCTGLNWEIQRWHFRTQHALMRKYISLYFCHTGIVFKPWSMCTEKNVHHFAAKLRIWHHVMVELAISHHQWLHSEPLCSINSKNSLYINLKRLELFLPVSLRDSYKSAIDFIGSSFRLFFNTCFQHFARRRHQFLVAHSSKQSQGPANEACFPSATPLWRMQGAQSPRLREPLLA